jgi:hypothetical protein
MAPEFRYERRYIEQRGLGPIEPITRGELRDRLVDWVKDPELSISFMEQNPGEWVRTVPFAFYRAVVDDTYKRLPEQPGSYRPGSLYDDGALDEEDTDA